MLGTHAEEAAHRPGLRQPLPDHTGPFEPFAIPLDHHGHVVPRNRPHHDPERVEPGSLHSGHRHDPVTGQHPHLVGGRSRHDLSDLPDLRIGNPHHPQQHHQEDDRHEEVGGRAREADSHATGIRLEPVRAVLQGRVHLLQVGHAGYPHVGTGGNGLDAVLGLTPSDRPQPRAEAHEELRDLHSRQPGHHEVAELVEGQHAHERGHHDKHRGTAQQAEGRHDTDQQH